MASPALTRRRISGAKLGSPKDEILAFRQGVADAQSPVVWNTDDIARIGFVGQLPVLREEELRRVERDIFARADELGLHASRQFARTNAQKSDPVAMIWVHVRLDFEHEAGHFFLACFDGSRSCLTPVRRRCQIFQRVDQVAPPELRKALPKKTGVKWPSKNGFWSKALRPARRARFHPGPLRNPVRSIGRQ